MENLFKIEFVFFSLKKYLNFNKKKHYFLHQNITVELVKKSKEIENVRPQKK